MTKTGAARFCTAVYVMFEMVKCDKMTWDMQSQKAGRGPQVLPRFDAHLHLPCRGFPPHPELDQLAKFGGRRCKYRKV